jgi:hypothetical protein
MSAHDGTRAKSLKELARLQAEIGESTSLATLLAALRRYAAWTDTLDDSALEDYAADAVDMTELPTFGGEEPRDTHGVWSWDNERLLVGDCIADFRIVAREELES